MLKKKKISLSEHMTYHEEHLPQAIPEIIQRVRAENCLLLGRAGKVADKGQETRIRGIRDPSKHLLTQHLSCQSRCGLVEFNK